MFLSAAIHIDHVCDTHTHLYIIVVVVVDDVAVVVVIYVNNLIMNSKINVQ